MKRLQYVPKDQPSNFSWWAPSSDIHRMTRCLRNAGYEVSYEDLTLAWKAVSSATNTIWRKLPRSNDKLLSNLLEYLKTDNPQEGPRKFTSRIVDAGDGTGDGILLIPDEVIQAMGWREDDVFDVKITTAICIVATKC